MSFWKVKLGFDILKWLGGKMKTKCRVELIRYHETKTEILGLLYVDGKFACYTLELPWKNNLRDVSCIPEDTYTVGPNPTGSNSFRIKDVPGRTLINIEVGNSHIDTEGCILVGMGVGKSSRSYYLTSSEDAINKLKDILGNSEFQIDIERL